VRRLAEACTRARRATVAATLGRVRALGAERGAAAAFLRAALLGGGGEGGGGEGGAAAGPAGPAAAAAAAEAAELLLDAFGSVGAVARASAAQVLAATPLGEAQARALEDFFAAEE